MNNIQNRMTSTTGDGGGFQRQKSAASRDKSFSKKASFNMGIMRQTTVKIKTLSSQKKKA